MQKIDRVRIERAARIYASNEEASRAIGIAAGSFSRLCRLYDIETPYARKRRRWSEARQRKRDLDILLMDLDKELDISTILAYESEMEGRKAS
jgi:hypothetical protein